MTCLFFCAIIQNVYVQLRTVFRLFFFVLYGRGRRWRSLFLSQKERRLFVIISNGSIEGTVFFDLILCQLSRTVCQNLEYPGTTSAEKTPSGYLHVARFDPCARRPGGEGGKINQKYPKTAERGYFERIRAILTAVHLWPS